MALIDFHCHLDLYENPHRVAAEAARRGVYVLSVTTVPSAFVGTLKLAPKDSRIRTALGLHPELAVAREGELGLFEQLLPDAPYVGEVGLDGSPPHRAHLDRQGVILSKILQLCAREGGRTISMHSRGATRLLLDVIESEPLAGRPVLHWFSGSDRDVERASRLGCWFSVGSAMLRSEKGRRSVARMPVDRILPETDGPFRVVGDEPLYPWQAMKVVGDLAALIGKSEVETDRQMNSNFKTLTAFSGAAEQRPGAR